MKRFVTLAGILAVLAVASLLAVGCQAAPAAPATAAPAAAAQPAAPATAAPAAAAQPAAQTPAFPTRPIDYICPFNQGGGSSITAELISKIAADQKLSPQPLVVSYKPGASGAIGWSYVVGRKGDAHTIATVGAAFLTGPSQGNSPLDPVNDFTHLALFGFDQIVLVANVDSPYKTLQDVIDASKKEPRSVKVAVTSLAMEIALLSGKAGIEFNMIPFGGGGDVNAAVLGGQTDLATNNPTEYGDLIEAGKLRPLAVFSEKRIPRYPDVPTVKEAGYDVVFRSERGVVAPPGITKHEQDWLIGLFKRVTETSEFAAYLDKNMIAPAFITADDYKKYNADTLALQKQILKDMAVKK